MTWLMIGGAENLARDRRRRGQMPPSKRARTDPPASPEVILCYGDSNTYGASDVVEGERLPHDQRWTTRLQEVLGDAFLVLPEGLNGRTFDLRPVLGQVGVELGLGPVKQRCHLVKTARVAGDHVEAAEILLGAGADPLAATRLGDTPLQYAKRLGRTRLAAALQAAASDARRFVQRPPRALRPIATMNLSFPRSSIVSPPSCCIHSCHGRGRCVQSRGGGKCACYEGYQGDDCETPSPATGSTGALRWERYRTDIILSPTGLQGAVIEK